MAGLVDDDGVLPPWTRWWSREQLADIIPDHLFDSIDAACPQVPLSYLDTRISPPAGWAESGCAYLAFGNTYAAEQAFARGRHWPVQVIEGGHLHFLHDPPVVADHLLDLVSPLRQ